MTHVLPISFSLNGLVIAVDVPAHTLLLDLIRDRLGLEGTKCSCDMEVCGACTVLLDGEPISSCTTLAVDVDRREVTTIEGVTPPSGLSRIQKAFVLHGAFSAASARQAVDKRRTIASRKTIMKSARGRCELA